MALVECPECDGQVSDSAVACPHCGYLLREAGVHVKSGGFPTWLAWALGVAALGCHSVGVESRQEAITANLGKAKEDIAVIEVALDEFALNNYGRWPDSLQDLITPDENGFTFLKGTSGPLDPWKNEYSYEPPTPGQSSPTITCYGADGRKGGTGEDRDFDNHMIRRGDI